MIPVKLLLLLTILNCTVFSNSRIFGKIQKFDSTEIWDHPWMVDVTIEYSVNRNKILTYHCVGALVHERALLTSGLCLNRTSPHSNKTVLQIHGDVLDHTKTATEERKYAMADITYHNFEFQYDSRKFDYCLVLLYDRIIHDSDSGLTKVIPVAKQEDIEDINFNDCILTSISLHVRKKMQVPVTCRLTSYLLNCDPKDDDSIRFDSGSSVICKRKNNPDAVLVGFISGYRRLKINGKSKLLPFYTSLSAIGSNLTYNKIDSFINRFIT